MFTTVPHVFEVLTLVVSNQCNYVKTRHNKRLVATWQNRKNFMHTESIVEVKFAVVYTHAKRHHLVHIRFVCRSLLRTKVNVQLSQGTDPLPVRS